MAGWVKLHRSVTDSFVFQNPDRLKFWIWCLCKATHKPRMRSVGLKEVQLKEGQFIFGRKKASSELSMEESKIYRLLKTFEKRKKIEVESNNKFSVVTIVNWAFYQGIEQQSEQQSNNKLTTNEQQSNTNKNVKNERMKEYTTNELLLQTLLDYEIMRNKIKKPMTLRALNGILNKLDKLGKTDGHKISILEQSIEKCYTGVFDVNDYSDNNNSSGTTKKFKTYGSD